MRKRIVRASRAAARQIELLLNARVPMGTMFGIRTR
jgi:hypothetical protein